MLVSSYFPMVARKYHLPFAAPFKTDLLPVDDMTRRLDELEASLTASGTDSASATPTK